MMVSIWNKRCCSIFDYFTLIL